jgi:uncharacterized Zn-binding protein involved in type VI secretion
MSIPSQHPHLRLCLVALTSFVAAPHAQATIFTVGSGQTFATPERIVWSKIHPGDTVLIDPGTYPSLLGTGNSMAVDSVVGTAAKPITVRGSDAANPPKLDAGIVVAGGSQYVQIGDLDVSRDAKTESYGAVVVQGKSAHIVLSGLKVHDSFVGIEFVAAGLGNEVLQSQVYGNVQHGITAGPPDASFVPDANHRSFITDNAVHDNGAHGIEITGPDWAVEHNRLSNNGGSVHGTSGIHLYSPSGVSGTYGCSENLVSYNFVTGQRDVDGTDGNGIQIDDFCDDNEVSFNVVWANAGAGISVLDGKGNVVRANTSYSNATDLGRAKKLPGVFRGEIILGSMADLCANPFVPASECHVAAGRSSGNVVANNIMVSGQSAVPGLFVSDDAVRRNKNVIDQNMYDNLGSGRGVELSWDAAAYDTETSIDAITGQASRGGGSLVGKPAFLDAANPTGGGLELSAKPGADGSAALPAAVDMSGRQAEAGDSYFGAYYTAP